MYKQLFSILLCSLFIFSCGEDEEAEIAALPGEFTVLIDGVEFRSSQVQAVTESGLTNITAVDDEGQVMTITISGSETGTYDLIRSSTNVVAFVSNENVTYLSNASSVGGSLTITKFDEENKLISGSLTTELAITSGEETVQLSEGSFTDIQIVEAQTGNTVTGTLAAKVDGVDWVDSSTSLNKTLGLIYITSINSTASITLTLSDDATVGEYDISSFSDYTGLYTTGSTSILALEGKIEVTAHNLEDRTITGNFYFDGEELVGTSTVSITEGTFSGSY